MLGPEVPMTQTRRGEFFFNDASLCLQSWQSCASCHPDARTDALNWDLLNDGIGPGQRFDRGDGRGHDRYVGYHDQERIHPVFDCRTPMEERTRGMTIEAA